MSPHANTASFPALPISHRARRFALHREKALALFAEKGFAAVGMRELAAQMGVTPGALYHHYPSKQHLLFDFVEEFYDELLTALEHMNVAAVDRVGEIISAHLDLYARLHWHFRIATRDGGSLPPELQDEVLDLKERYHHKLASLLDFQRFECADEMLAVNNAIAALLNSTPTWAPSSTLEEHAQRALLENLLRGAIERLLGHAPTGPKKRRA